MTVPGNEPGLDGQLRGGQAEGFTRDRFRHRQTRKTYEEYCREPVTLQDLEDARDIIAYAITQDGPIYAPMLERLEREIREYRAREDVVARANAYVENRLRDQAALALGATGESAIADRYLSLSFNP